VGKNTAQYLPHIPSADIPWFEAKTLNSLLIKGSNDQQSSCKKELHQSNRVQEVQSEWVIISENSNHCVRRQQKLKTEVH